MQRNNPYVLSTKYNPTYDEDFKFSIVAKSFLDGEYGVLIVKRFFGALPKNKRIRGEKEFRNPRHLFVESDYYTSEENKEDTKKDDKEYLIKSRNSNHEIGQLNDTTRHQRNLLEKCEEIHESDFPADYRILRDVKEGRTKASGIVE
ncbi:MAG: hypothetical protein BTN85_1243 [Candidatus Methanohalarchaeum thermophilum]|uniref:Uncharacterized protein n=1 Tax=Methanohalarchaeum thermophilum TaxID=1903181 RepID=A0A1Q6DWK3_METT1|nr:MAG: hypothetical protein BTN85_1243 [Candidatus Methanohalarchaeum thermophilum]